MSRGFSPAALAAFALTFRPWMRRRIGAIHLAGLAADPAPRLPLVVVANHVSWWDPFLLWELRRVLRPDAPMHVVMLESELRRHRFLARIGAVGIEPAARASVGRAVRELERRTRERPDSLVFFFPQGRIAPSFRRPLGFRRGIELLARRLAPASVLPVGLHLEPMTGPAPHAWISAGAPVPAGEAPSAARLEAAVEAELDGLLAFLARHGEDAPRRWPAAVSGRLPAPDGPDRAAPVEVAR